jgi:hypothetical protein
MARNRGGFGGGGWLGDAGSTASAGPATAPAPRRSGGGGGGGNDRRDIQSSLTRRERRQERRQKRRDDGVVEPPVDDGGLSGLDQNQMDLAFEDPNPDTLRLGALGMLERAGIDFGTDTTDAQKAFLEETMAGWVDSHLGDTLVNDPNNTWGAFMDDMVLTPEEKAAQQAATDAVIAPVEDPLGYRDWASETLGLGRRDIREMNDRKRKRTKTRYQTYLDELAGAGEDPNDGLGPGAGAGETDWIWNEGIRDKLSAEWAQLSPEQRGYNSARWVAPKRTIQF